MIRNTIDQLAAFGVPIPPEVYANLDLLDASRRQTTARHRAEDLIREKFQSGELTASNLTENLIAGSILTLACIPNPQAGGIILWEAARTVAELAEGSVRGCISGHFDSVILPTFEADFSKHVATVEANIGKVVPSGSSHQAILAGGKRALEAARLVAEADAALVEILNVIRSTAAAVGLPAGLSLFVDPGDAEMPPENFVSALVRAGFEVGLHDSDRVLQIELQQQQLAAARQHAEEVEQWRPRIQAEAKRLADMRDRGLRPRFALQVPAEFEYLINEAAEEFGLKAGVNV
jgi:hypothetical protein